MTVAAMNEASHLPELVRTYVARSLPPDPAAPATVRVRQTGEMRKKPEARARRFEAVEDFAVHRLAFAWQACFPMVGPLAMRVVDEFADGDGRLRVSLLGVPLGTQTGREISIGQAMRYLAELVWAPQAIASNRELEWRPTDERTAAVSASFGPHEAEVRWEFDAAGDVVRVTGTRPFPVGGRFIPRSWGGDFGAFDTFGGTRVPTLGEAWWDLPEGRFVYWRGRVTSLELLGKRP